VDLFRPLHISKRESDIKNYIMGTIRVNTEGSCPAIRGVQYGEMPSNGDYEEALPAKLPLERHMPKRNLRVLKWLGTVPAVGVCTLCNREFKVPMDAMKRVGKLTSSR
jgi:hypothetical protein